MRLKPIHIDLHVHFHGDLALTHTQLGEQMSALTDAFDRMTTRVAADFARLQALLEEALATDPDNQAEIDRLTAEVERITADNAAMLSDQTDVIARLDTVDPDPNA